METNTLRCTCSEDATFSTNVKFKHDKDMVTLKAITTCDVCGLKGKKAKVVLTGEDISNEEIDKAELKVAGKANKNFQKAVEEQLPQDPEDVSQKFEEVLEDVGEIIEGIGETIKRVHENRHQTKADIKERADEIKDAVEDAGETVKEVAGDVKDKFNKTFNTENKEKAKKKLIKFIKSL